MFFLSSFLKILPTEHSALEMLPPLVLICLQLQSLHIQQQQLLNPCLVLFELLLSHNIPNMSRFLHVILSVYTIMLASVMLEVAYDGAYPVPQPLLTPPVSTAWCHMAFDRVPGWRHSNCRQPPVFIHVNKCVFLMLLMC